jgi:hypothetical protein
MEVRLEKAARADMQKMIGAFRVSQMIAGAARLRLADHLVGGPHAVHDLARLTGTHEESTLLVVEPVVRPVPESCLAMMADVQMMVRTGGRNRTEKELRELLTAAGFRLERILPTTGPDVAVASLVE